MKRDWRRRSANFVLLVVFSYVGLALADALLRLTPINVHVGRHDRNVAAAEARGVAFDTRSGWQVITDLRREGTRAYPFVTAAHFRRGDLDPATRAGDRLVPIGGIAEVATVACNETGTWMVYVSDARGFNNPPDLYDERPRAVVVGDSFAHGTCLNRGLDFASRLRDALGPVLTFGVHGSGPVATLAQVREYAARLEPPVVVWAYYEGNDVTVDQANELRDPTLRRYLEPSFSQRLYDRQSTIDRLITSQIVAPVDPAAEADRGATWLDATLAVVTLREVRVLAAKSIGRVVRFGWARERWFDDQYREPLERFEQVLRTARDEVRGWGGRVVFLYLPSWEAFHAPWNDGVVLKPDVLEIVASLGIETVDVESVFRALDAPEDGFALGLPNHYSELGNRLVADALLQALDGPRAPRATRP